MINLILIILSYSLSKALLNRLDTLYLKLDKYAYRANEKGLKAIERLINKGAGSKLLWCGACQTFWLSLVLLNLNNQFIYSLAMALTTFTFIKLKPYIDEL